MGAGLKPGLMQSLPLGVFGWSSHFSGVEVFFKILIHPSFHRLKRELQPNSPIGDSPLEFPLQRVFLAKNNSSPVSPAETGTSTWLPD